MMVYICDRCGKTIPRPSGDWPRRRNICYGHAEYDDSTDGGSLVSMDVCESCYKSFWSWKSMYQTEEMEDDDED